TMCRRCRTSIRSNLRKMCNHSLQAPPGSSGPTRGGSSTRRPAACGTRPPPEHAGCQLRPHSTPGTTSLIHRQPPTPPPGPLRPLKPPAQFNPDPRALLRPPSTNAPFFKQELPVPPGFERPRVPQGLELPRNKLRSEELEFVQPPATNYGSEPLPKGLELPRE